MSVRLNWLCFGVNLDTFYNTDVFLYLKGTDSKNQSEILIDLVGLDSPSTPEHNPLASLAFPGNLLSESTVTDSQSKSVDAPPAGMSLLDEELLSLGTTPVM